MYTHVADLYVQYSIEISYTPTPPAGTACTIHTMFTAASITQSFCFSPDLVGLLDTLPESDG